MRIFVHIQVHQGIVRNSAELAVEQLSWVIRNVMDGAIHYTSCICFPFQLACGSEQPSTSLRRSNGLVNVTLLGSRSKRQAFKVQTKDGSLFQGHE